MRPAEGRGEGLQKCFELLQVDAGIYSLFFQCHHCLAQGNLNTFREKTKRLDGQWGGSQALVQTPGGKQLSGVSPFGEVTPELGFAVIPHISLICWSSRPGWSSP